MIPVVRVDISGVKAVDKAEVRWSASFLVFL